MKSSRIDQTRREALQVLGSWLKTCTRNGRISRNTVAIGIVVLDHLRSDSPVQRERVVSKGGEITGARSGLGKLLESSGIPQGYLKEVTTRQAHQDGQRLFDLFQWGSLLSSLTGDERSKLALELIRRLRAIAMQWLQQQNLKLSVDRRLAPTTWVKVIVENAKGRSGGVVEQHLVGAKLERRFKNLTVENFPAHAGDRQTDRKGDFTIAKSVYHVTASPSRSLLQKCAANVEAGLQPVLLVPKDQENRARVLAQDERVDSRLAIISIEDFVALNIIELANEEGKDFFTILKEIVEIYNRRLTQVETDLSLQIEVK